MANVRVGRDSRDFMRELDQQRAVAARRETTQQPAPMASETPSPSDPYALPPGGGTAVTAPSAARGSVAPLGGQSVDGGRRQPAPEVEDLDIPASSAAAADGPSTGLAQAAGRVRERIDAACRRSGRDPLDVDLVCVSKGVAPEQLAGAVVGLATFGENRVQEAEAKVPMVSGATWHLVGHLQANKAGRAVRLFSIVSRSTRSSSPAGWTGWRLRHRSTVGRDPPAAIPSISR